jgi:hypothetical protein
MRWRDPQKLIAVNETRALVSYASEFLPRLRMRATRGRNGDLSIFNFSWPLPGRAARVGKIPKIDGRQGNRFGAG